MSGTAEGRRKGAQTMITGFGGCLRFDNCDRCKEAEVAYERYMAEIAARGGKRRVRKGGLLNPQNRDTSGPTRGRWNRDATIKREQRMYALLEPPQG
jgi:hypothetical protein